jgi:hypothetical protein
MAHHVSAAEEPAGPSRVSIRRVAEPRT